MQEKGKSRMTPEFLSWNWVGGESFRYRKQEVVPGKVVKENESTFFFFSSVILNMLSSRTYSGAVLWTLESETQDRSLC